MWTKMSKVITFDFDNTIAMSHMDISGGEVRFIFEEYNEQIINLMKKYISNIWHILILII